MQAPAEKQCTSCKGTGYAKEYFCPTPDDKYETCETCKGLGYVPDDGN